MPSIAVSKQGGVEFPNNIKVYTKKDVVGYDKWTTSGTYEQSEAILIYDENPLFYSFDCSYNANYYYTKTKGTSSEKITYVPFVSTNRGEGFLNVTFITDKSELNDVQISGVSQIPDDFIAVVKAQPDTE